LKQVELAKRAGITEGMVSFILSGERRPSWDVAKKLAKATGTDPYLWMEYKISEMLEAVKDAD
jgi:transcriptional regulator with XRE-family HTH domain